ncbi:MAG: aminotransferase class V-fold PLP-dependent enzyme [Flavobacteriales bacterium]|nr:aminotransferase class V-fold PLP-dependent enzyme [Flavobacteriales bacterium]
MKDLESEILALEESSSLLEVSNQDQEKLLHETKEFTQQFINDLPHLKAFKSNSVKKEKLQIDEQPILFSDILKVYKEEVVDNGIIAASEGHLGYIPGGGIYSAAIADFIAAVTNEYAGVYYASPGAVSIENEVLDWLIKIFGFPKTTVGNLTSGGSIANLIALTSARDYHNIKNEIITKSVVYLSPQSHHCINKAFKILGLEDIIIRFLELDDLGKVKTDNLEKLIIKDQLSGLNPFLIIASAGTTDTGVVDPLQEIGDIARKNKLWYHIDGAYGGFFILTKSKSDLFKGIELADSLVVDPHKGLFLPYGLGAVLIKNKEAVFKTYSHAANYMQDALHDSTPINPSDLSPELSKHFRGLRLWIPLKLHGITPFIACLEEKILLTKFIRNELIQLGFLVGPKPDLTVTYFWYPSILIEENIFNKKLMDLIHKDGRVFLSSTNLDGRFVIRVAILSFRTKLSTIKKCLGMITDSLKKTISYFE